MGVTTSRHRPLLAGIGIKASDGRSGTLTGLATRHSDGKKVLVTNLHVVSTSGWTVSGSEEMYQWAVNNADKVGRLYTERLLGGSQESWVPVKTGLLQSNTADVAALELLPGVDADFDLHDHPNHGSRKVIAGVVEPRIGMKLTMLGATSGEGTVTVIRTGAARPVDGTGFTGLTILRGDSISRPGQGGDSGAPCLLEDDAGRYRMSCIVLGGWNLGVPGLNLGEGFAFPASVAEEKLGITFGEPAPPPPAEEVQDIARDAMSWVAHRVRSAPKSDGSNDPDKQVASMYPAWPLTAKVPPGHTISGAQGDGDYVRHLGDEFVWRITPPPQPPASPIIVNDSIEIELIHRRAASFRARAKVGRWADGQPPIVLELRRDYQTDGRVQTEIRYAGKPAGDTRTYPIKVYFAGEEIISDHRTVQAGRVFRQTTRREVGLNSNKYFVRTENIPASKLMKGYRGGVKMRSFHLPLWNRDDDWDIHSPLFAAGYDKPDGYMFENPPRPMYHDCSVGHRDWPRDDYRGASAGGWGFSHRSKVCTLPKGYTWLLRQDGLGLMAQAIHVMMKYNDPDHEYESPWPGLWPGGPPSPLTPKRLADYVWDRWYRNGIGVTMTGVPILNSLPIIGDDTQRASSLRTNQMLVLQTLLGYHYDQGALYKARANTIADILRQVQVGHSPQPANGVKTQTDGDIVRPTFAGAQLFAWTTVSSLGVTDFGWIRSTINQLLDLPPDDLDYVLSTVEATATYGQAFRVYLYHKYGIVLGDWASIPGISTTLVNSIRQRATAVGDMTLGTFNRRPTAYAGADQVVNKGATVRLDASRSSDLDGDTLTYSWTQTSGPNVTLSSTTAESPTFTAPSTLTTLAFRVTVTDSRRATDTDDVTIRVTRPPVADAGIGQTVASGATVTLDGSGSGDPDGGTLKYLWEQGPGVGGGEVVLSDATAVSPTFTAPSHAAALTFKLTVTDGQGASASDTVTITVVPRPAAPSNLRATPGDGQIALSWDDPDDASITQYKYRLRSGTSRWGRWAVIPQSGPATVTYVKTGLTNGTAYTVRVRAINASGNGAPAQVGPVTPTA